MSYFRAILEARVICASILCIHFPYARKLSRYLRVRLAGAVRRRATPKLLSLSGQSSFCGICAPTRCALQAPLKLLPRYARNPYIPLAGTVRLVVS